MEPGVGTQMPRSESWGADGRKAAGGLRRSYLGPAAVLALQIARPLLRLLGARGPFHPQRGHQADRGVTARGHQPGAQ